MKVSGNVDTTTIILLIIVFGVLTFYVVDLIKTVKRSPSRYRKDYLYFLPFGGAFIAYLAYLTSQVGEIEPADRAQILLMSALVAVTFVYAFSAMRQANASVRMAEEMREQRLSEARPYLLIRLADELLQWDDTEQDRRPHKFEVTIRNVGKGPAINLWVALWHSKNTYFAGDSKSYLVAGEEWQTTISRLDTRTPHKEGWLPQLSKVIKENKAGIIAVEYQDVHKRKWASYLCLERHVDIEQCVMEGEQNIVEINQND